MAEKNLGIYLKKEQDEYLEKKAELMQNSKSGVVRYLIEEDMRNNEQRA